MRKLHSKSLRSRFHPKQRQTPVYGHKETKSYETPFRPRFNTECLLYHDSPDPTLLSWLGTKASRGGNHGELPDCRRSRHYATTLVISRCDHFHRCFRNGMLACSWLQRLCMDGSAPNKNMPENLQPFV